MARPVTFQTAHVTSEDGTLDIGSLDDENVRFCVRTDEAYALNPRGRRIWQAQITGVERPTRDKVVVTLADGPKVTAVKFCRPCKQH